MVWVKKLEVRRPKPEVEAERDYRLSALERLLYSKLKFIKKQL
jgi:hypothetical protein